MNILDYLKNEWHIDPVIMLIVIAAGFFQNAYMRGLTLSKDGNTNGALKTLLVSAVVSIIYLVLTMPGRDKWAMYLISYFAATSFYELIVRPLKKMLEQKADDNNTPVIPLNNPNTGA